MYGLQNMHYLSFLHKAKEFEADLSMPETEVLLEEELDWDNVTLGELTSKLTSRFQEEGDITTIINEIREDSNLTELKKIQYLKSLYENPNIDRYLQTMGTLIAARSLPISISEIGLGLLALSLPFIKESSVHHLIEQYMTFGLFVLTPHAILLRWPLITNLLAKDIKSGNPKAESYIAAYITSSIKGVGALSPVWLMDNKLASYIFGKKIKNGFGPTLGGLYTSTLSTLGITPDRYISDLISNNTTLGIYRVENKFDQMKQNASDKFYHAMSYIDEKYPEIKDKIAHRSFKILDVIQLGLKNLGIHFESYSVKEPLKSMVMYGHVNT